jgi:dihydrofolate synthase/folylpolyglutamate synthase
MTYAEALLYMSSLRRFGVKLGNERMDALLDMLGNPHRRYGVVHVTGTKGKGSTTALVAAILQAHGFRAGGYFSPYVYDVRERVQVGGDLISESDLTRLVERLAPLADSVEAMGLGSVTEFELKTALGFLHFADTSADYAAIEVGIGGRLDATNVVTPLAAVITNVGLDHTDILGDTVALIAAEKAGIIKPGVDVITAAEDPDALDVITERARTGQARLVRVEAARPGTTAADVTWADTGPSFEVRTGATTYTDLRLKLVGAHQRTNAACAVAAVEAVARADGWMVSPDAIRAGLARVELPGRFSVLRERPTVIADGAHNAMSARSLAEEVGKLARHRLVLVVGMLRGHDPELFMREIAPMASVVIATEPTWRRAEAADVVADAARAYCGDVRIVTPPAAAAQAALELASGDDIVLITGSFYTVGDVPRDLSVT